LKRSNRLVLLIGVFLAIVAFVGILVLISGNNTGDGQIKAPTTGPVVVAVSDIPLSTRIRSDQVTTKTVDLTAILPGAFTDPSQVVGLVARQPAAAGAQITQTTVGATQNGVITNINTPPGLRTIAVSVDQVTGVGTLIKSGDYVDMVIGLASDKFPVVEFSPVDKSVTIVSGLNGTSVKLILQGMQVVGTLLPPVAAPAEPAPSSSPGAGTGTPTALNGQTELVILAVTAQQAEVIKFAQMDASVTLVLRSADDFIDPVTGEAKVPETVETTGVILKTLVDLYGVLPPEIIQTVTPSAPPSARP
jgi:pilus assembly protein CpaB